MSLPAAFKAPVLGFAQKANLTTDEADDTDFELIGFASLIMVLIELFDPCKSVLSVLSVVRFSVFASKCAGFSP